MFSSAPKPTSLSQTERAYSIWDAVNEMNLINAIPSESSENIAIGAIWFQPDPTIISSFSCHMKVG